MERELKCHVANLKAALRKERHSNHCQVLNVKAHARVLVARNQNETNKSIVKKRDNVIKEKHLKFSTRKQAQYAKTSYEQAQKISNVQMKRLKTAKEDLDLVKTVYDDLNHKIATPLQAQPQPIVTIKKS
eukprot:14908435-Ditylum_brightwellii.AAC.1